MPYTDTNTFTNYHNQLSDLILDNDTKLLTSYFNLDNSDILSLELSNIIYINSTHYIINSINDFNINGQRLTKVELIRIPNEIL